MTGMRPFHRFKSSGGPAKVFAYALATLVFAFHSARANAANAPDTQTAADLTGLSIEDLGNVVISSVSKTAEPLSDAPAAIYVITHEDIVRSGATSLPEILRLAPNLQVAQITADTFAISARGFNSAAADKLLVLIDGRSVYTPYFSGVLWDRQYVLPDDIERVEVISGPGGTLWGANAVNGVINIITRKSSETQGGTVELGGGNLERRASVQYGGKLNDDLSYRAYFSGFSYADDRTSTGADARDGWDQTQGGFRIDSTKPGDRVTVQGDFYNGSEEQLSGPNGLTDGQNLLARWTHQMDGGSELQIQTYYDDLESSVPGGVSDYLRTYDLDVQHSFRWGEAQQVVWGGGYRITQDNFPAVLANGQLEFFSPQGRTLGLGNVFGQDTISLPNRLQLILGLRLEDDPYTGLEPLPSIRLSWKLSDSNLVWAAVSRAVRAPSRLDRDFFEALPGSSALEIAGGDFQPEKLIAYELGYRAQPSSNTSISIATFYNVYQDLRSAEFSPTGGLPLTFENGMQGDTYGIEVWGNYRVNDWWRLTAGVNWLHENLGFKPGSSQIGGIEIAGDDPNFQYSVRSTMNLSETVALDLSLRKIGALPAPFSPSYVELDGRIGWNVSKSLEISLRGLDLLHRNHVEFGTTTSTLQVGPIGVETGRSVFLDAKWKF